MIINSNLHILWDIVFYQMISLDKINVLSIYHKCAISVNAKIWVRIRFAIWHNTVILGTKNVSCVVVFFIPNAQKSFITPPVRARYGAYLWFRSLSDIVYHATYVIPETGVCVLVLQIPVRNIYGTEFGHHCACRYPCIGQFLYHHQAR